MCVCMRACVRGVAWRGVACVHAWVCVCGVCVCVCHCVLFGQSCEKNILKGPVENFQLGN